MVTDSEAADIIRFLEQKGLLCKECGEEATFHSDWLDHHSCPKHLKPGHGTNYYEQHTKNKLYRNLLRLIGEWHTEGLSQAGWRSRRGDAPLDPGGAPASELHPVNVGKELPTVTQALARAHVRYGGGVKGGGDPLGADVDCYK